MPPLPVGFAICAHGVSYIIGMHVYQIQFRQIRKLAQSISPRPEPTPAFVKIRHLHAVCIVQCVSHRNVGFADLLDAAKVAAHRGGQLQHRSA